MAGPRFEDEAVAARYDAYPKHQRETLMKLRSLVHDTASTLDGCGAIVEALKWNQPSFLTERPKSGSTIRVHSVRDDQVGIFFHCQSGLVPAFRERYGDQLTFEGNRAIILPAGGELPTEMLSHCIAMALTHHSRKKA